MPRKTFDDELRELREGFDKMGELIESALTGCIESFKKADMDIALEVSKNDKLINAMEHELQSKTLTLILRQQPVAGDLREISTILRAVTDLERIGDQAADISESVLNFAKKKRCIYSERFNKIAEKSVNIVKLCIRAFVERDTKLSTQVIEMDDEIDMLFNSIKEEIIAAIKQDGSEYDELDMYVDLLMIAKHFEKIGDHAVNIAEWTKFRETGILQNDRLI